MNKPKILVFASGSAEGGGSGFENLVRSSRGELIRQKPTLEADIVGVVSNHPNGGVHKRAAGLGVPFLYYSGPWTADAYQKAACWFSADYFALSGWLKLVKGLDPGTRFNSRTVFNIHPGPLPRFGGPGMYGHHVHEAVMRAYEERTVFHSAICMHFVTEPQSKKDYDRGPVFFQCSAEIKKGDTPDILGRRLNCLEHKHQPIITNLVVTGQISWDGVNPGSLQVPADYRIEQTAS